MEGKSPEPPLVRPAVVWLVVGFLVLVLAALLTIGVNTNRGIRGSPNEALILMLSGACRQDRLEFGAYPAQDKDLATGLLVAALTGRRGSSPPLVEFLPGQLSGTAQVLDTWGRPLRYRCPGLRNPSGFDLESAGKNGVFGDDDDLWNGPGGL